MRMQASMTNEQYPIKYDELWMTMERLQRLHLKHLRSTVYPLSDNVPEWKRRRVFLNCYIKKPSLMCCEPF